MRKEGFYGSTWILEQDQEFPKYVYVQRSLCSPEDQFSRKKGVSVAKLMPSLEVHKADLIYLGSDLSSKHVKPTIEQIYQAVIRL